MRFTIEDYRNDPGLRAALERAAQRERSREMARLFARLLARIKWALLHAERRHVQGRVA